MRKLMWFAIGFMLAMVLGIYAWSGSNALLLAAGSAFVLAGFLYLLSRWKKFRIAVAIFLGCVVGFLWLFLFDSLYLSTPRAADGEKINMTLIATNHSEETDYGTSTDCVCILNGKPYRLRLYLPEEAQMEPGDRVTANVDLACVLPDCQGESDYLASEGIFLTAGLSWTPEIEKADHLPWYGYPSAVRRTVKTVLQQAMPEDVTAFATALLIGDKTDLDYETDTAFKVSGIRHIIAVSGLHVTILFSLIYLLVGRKKLPAMIVGIPMLAFFAAVAGFTPSVVRACIMHGLMILAMLISKEYDPPTALAFAALTMLVVDPWTITSVGFQLSVSCMAGIFLLADPITRWMMDRKRFGKFRGKKRKFLYGVASSIGVSVGATVAVTPLCAYYFETVSLVGLVTNLLTLWVITAVFYGVMATCLLGIVWLPLGKILGAVVAWPIRYVLILAKVISKFPLAAIYIQSVYIVAWLIFAYLLLGVFLLMRKKPVVLTLCCMICGLFVALLASWTEPLTDECRATVLDVGQGQCIILQSQGRTFVVDCGGDSDTQAADRAANCLMSQGIFRIDGLILTHFDADHAGGVQYFAERIKIGGIYVPDCADEDGMSRTLPQSAETSTITEMVTLSYGDTKITLIPSLQRNSDNESGLCILFQTENCDILITGDRSTAGELELMSQIQLPELELLIVGHHGSKYSTCQQLLEVTRPKTAVVSVGENNLYGHPAQEVLERLSAVNCTVYRTDENGDVTYRG